MKKSNYKVVAEGIAFNKLDKAKLMSTPNVRKLTVEEIKQIIVSELKEANDKALVKATELENGWDDAEPENYMDWVKALKLKEIFQKNSK